MEVEIRTAGPEDVESLMPLFDELCDMMDFSPFQGIAQFGPAYRIMLENDPHAPGSVDRVLIERMVRLYIETADCLYEGYTAVDLKYQAGSLPELERYVKQAGADEGDEEERLAKICEFCAGRAKGATDNLDEMLFGGTEGMLKYHRQFRPDERRLRLDDA